MNILFVAIGNEKWLGGVYYIKNIIFQLLCYAKKRKRVNIYIYVNDYTKSIYKDFERYANVYIIEKNSKTYSCFSEIKRSLFGSVENYDIAGIVLKYRIKMIYPCFGEGVLYRLFLLQKSIMWIPDFQETHYPNFFKKAERKHRYQENSKKAHFHRKLVLSSQDAYSDYAKLFPDCLKNVYVVHFAAYLEKKIVVLNDVDGVKKKFDIDGNYFMIANQFWVHKNHLVAFEAINKLAKANGNVQLICTGKLEDTRDKKYARKIKNYIEENRLERNIRLLGIVDKKEQIQLMKGAIAVIQPSLFEGWGTCVEEAKTLGKITVLSDIDVHREQMNEKSILFGKNDSDNLAEVLGNLWHQYEGREPEWNYHTADAPKYGKAFCDMLMDRS